MCARVKKQLQKVAQQFSMKKANTFVTDVLLLSLTPLTSQNCELLKCNRFRYLGAAGASAAHLDFSGRLEELRSCRWMSPKSRPRARAAGPRQTEPRPRPRGAARRGAGARRLYQTLPYTVPVTVSDVIGPGIEPHPTGRTVPSRVRAVPPVDHVPAS